MLAYIPYISLAFTFIGLAFTMFVFWSNRNGVEKKEHQEIIKKLQVSIDNHSQLHTSHQLEREKLVDLNNQRMQHLETRVSQVDQIIQEVQTLKMKQEAISVQLVDLKEQIKDQRADQKESAKEIMELIKKGK